MANFKHIPKWLKNASAKPLRIQSWFLRTALCFRSTECQKNKLKRNYNFALHDKINVRGWWVTEGTYSLTYQPNQFVTLNRNFATEKRRQKENLSMDASSLEPDSRYMGSNSRKRTGILWKNSSVVRVRDVWTSATKNINTVMGNLNLPPRSSIQLFGAICADVHFFTYK
jgi:hypothetical protein